MPGKAEETEMLCHRSSITTGPLRRIFNRRNASHIFAMKTGNVQSFFIILHWKLIWLWNVCDQTTHISSTQHVSITRVAWWRMVASQQKSTGFFPKVQRQLVRVWARVVVCCLSVLALRQTGKLSRMYPGCNPLLTGYILSWCYIKSCRHSKIFFFFYQYYSPESLLKILHCGAYQKQA